MHNGSREELMYCMCIVPPDQRHRRHDYMATVDLDPKSPTFSQVSPSSSRSLSLSSLQFELKLLLLILASIRSKVDSLISAADAYLLFRRF